MAQAHRRITSAPKRAAATPHPLLHRYIQPLDPTSVEHPPSGQDWIHEIKFDGYRAQAHKCDGRATVFSRRGYNWTDRFDSIGELVDGLPAESVILDGEVVYIGRNGKPDFQGLRGALGRNTDRLHLYAFDLLFLDGEDLRAVPLLERKRRLKALLSGAPQQLQYVEHMQGDSRLIVEHACKLGLEGIVSKQVESPYKSGRQESWRKSKCDLTDNFPIVAFVEKLGARPRRIASLYVGRREGDKLLYAGKVQSGYSLEAAREVREALDPYIRRKTPLSEPIVKPKATWVEPVVDAEVAYSSKTDAGLLREAVFKGLREDFAPGAEQPLRVTAHCDAQQRSAPLQHLAAATRGRCACRGGACRLLGEGREAGPGTLGPSPAEAGAPCWRHDLLSQGAAAAGPRLGPSYQDSQARRRRGSAPLDRRSRGPGRLGPDRGRRAAPVECDRRRHRARRPHGLRSRPGSGG